MCESLVITVYLLSFIVPGPTAYQKERTFTAEYTSRAACELLLTETQKYPDIKIVRACVPPCKEEQ